MGKYLLERLCLVYRVASPSQCVRKYWSLHVLAQPSDEYMNMIKIDMSTCSIWKGEIKKDVHHTWHASRNH